MENLENKLIGAIKKGNAKLVKELIDQGANVDAQDRSVGGKTALMHAARWGHTEIAKMLIDNGANLDMQDNAGRTALMCAANDGNAEIAKLLIEKGADKEARDNIWGETALMCVARRGHTEIAKMLIDNGANVDAQYRSEGGKTALMLAEQWGHTEIAKMLIDNGANLDMQDNAGRTALMWAAMYGHTEVVNLLIEKGANMEDQDNIWGYTALIIAASGGYTEVVNLLIEKGADKEARDDIGLTALMRASSGGHKEVVNLLIEKGANMEDQDNIWGYTALIIAASNGHTEVLNLLIERGADKEARDNVGLTALTEAARWGYKEVVNLLIEKGADIEARANDGETALMKAARWGYTGVVNLLIEKGADIEARANDGETALMKAARWGYTGVVNLLIEKGANIYLKNNNGETVLDIARREDREEIVQMIENIDMGLYFSRLAERVNEKKFQSVYKEVVKMLLERNPQYFDYNRDVDEFGKTALMRALENKQDNLAVYLVINGARLNCEDNAGKSVFRYMLENGNLGILKLCLETKRFVFSNDRVINILVNQKVHGNKEVRQVLDMIDLKDDSNVKVVKEFIKDHGQNEKLIKLLVDNGLDQEKMLDKEDFKIWISKDIKDTKKVYGMINALIRKDKDVVAEIISGNIDRIEVFSEKEEGYKIVVREKGKAYKRYICKESETGYAFHEKTKNNNRSWIVKKIRKVKKLAKKVYRRMVMKKMTYEGLKSRNKATPERENAPGMDQGLVRQM